MQQNTFFTVIFAFNYYNKILKITLFFQKKMYNEIKRELYATDCECESVQIKLYTADRLPCFCCQLFKKWLLKLGRMYQTAHQNDGFNVLRLNCINSTLPACAMIPNQQNFTRHDEPFNFSTIFSGCQIGQVRITFKSDQAQWFHLEVLPLQSRKSFEYFFCFHRTGILPKI